MGEIAQKLSCDTCRYASWKFRFLVLGFTPLQFCNRYKV